MTKYRNPREAAELAEADEVEREQELLAEPATTVEEEVWKKRYGDQRRYVDTLKADAKKTEEELSRKLDQALRGQIKAPKSESEIEAWMQQYPEFAGIFEAVVQKRISEGLRESNQRLEQVEEWKRELSVQEAVIELKKIHPDLDDLVKKNSDFRAWLMNQSERDQDAIINGLNVGDAAFVIDKYKSQTKKAPKPQGGREDLEAAKAIRTPAANQDFNEDFGDYLFSESQIERESRKNPRWYEANEVKIDEAARQGKINMDLSGGAR